MYVCMFVCLHVCMYVYCMYVCLHASMSGCLVVLRYVCLGIFRDARMIVDFSLWMPFRPST